MRDAGKFVAAGMPAFADFAETLLIKLLASTINIRGT